MRKRKRHNQQRSVSLKKPKARAFIGKPSQSRVSIALRLREASERLSSNGFPSAAQLVDVTKPEPIRMDFDVSMISPVTVAAPEAIDAPAPPPARRGRRRAPAQAPDPAPESAPNVALPATPPSITPERQAEINALYSAKARRDAERLQETYSLKVVYTKLQ